jgi:putative ABC transport system permease protein
MRGGPVSTLARQALQTARILRRAPGFTAAVVLALALGTGFGIPVLGLVQGAGLRAAPYVDPLLRAGVETRSWLPGVTAARQTIPEIQDGALRALLGVLATLALLLLSIALINLLALLLARAAARRPEVALRAVLGGAPWRLAGRLLVEAAVPLAAGGGLGLLVGACVAALLHGSWPGAAPPWAGPRAGGWIAAAVAGVFALAWLLAWLSPVGVAWRRELRSFLATGGRSTAGAGEVFTRHALAVVQVAASVVLLTGAGLLLRGFALAEEDGAGLGFDPRDTLTVQLRFSGLDGQGDPDRQRLYAELVRRITALPGVVDMGVATLGTWVGLGTTDRVTAVCLKCQMYPGFKPTSSALTRIHAVSPNFFGAVGAPLLRGRDLGLRDADGAPRVAVINDTFAARLFPSRFQVDPLGKQIQIGGSQGEWYTVVGVVDDIRAPGIGSGSIPVPALYLSTLQHPPAVANLAVRTTGDPMELLPAVEAAVHAAAPGAVLSDAMTLERYLERFRAPLGWFAALFSTLAGVALLLATSGLQAVMSYNASRRTREIGVRIALGARTGHVVRMVLRQGLRITCVGAALSLFGALALGRLLQLLLAGVEPFDPLLFGGIVGLLGCVALLASYGPARRAASVDPQISLREE